MSSEVNTSQYKLSPLIDILIVAAASAAAYFLEKALNDIGLINMSEGAKGVSAVLGGALATLILVKYRGGNWSDIGLKRPTRWLTVPFWVAGILIAFVVGQTVVPVIISQFMTLPEPDMSKYGDMVGNLRAATLMALILPLTASIPEEIIYRGFLIGRLESIFGTGSLGSSMAVIVHAIIFGSIHFQWGVGGMVMTFIMGIIWGTSYLLCGRNLWIVILAHSGGHLLLVLSLYLGTSVIS